MTINPRDYDLNELREMARERGDVSEKLGNTDAPDPDDWSMEGETANRSLRSELYRELLPLEAAADDDLEKPYLTGLPDTYAGEYVVFEWLEFLLRGAGYRGAQEAIGYYESVGWITEDVESDLVDYLLGVGDAERDDGELDVNDHMVSLVYVAKLVSVQ